MRSLGILIAVAAAAVACGETQETADAGTQTYGEAAGELAADVSAGAEDASDDAQKEAADAAAAIEEGIQTE